MIFVELSGRGVSLAHVVSWEETRTGLAVVTTVERLHLEGADAVTMRQALHAARWVGPRPADEGEAD